MTVPRTLAEDARAGLTATPKSLPPKWLYDKRGSELFDDITRLPEYYLTRAERALLTAHAGDIAAATGAETLVELGSGTSDKTRLLLDALRDTGSLRRFLPVDVDPSVLTSAGAAIAADYPGVAVRPVVGDLEHDLATIPTGGRRLTAFLGSTIGNLEPVPRARFLRALRATLAPGDALLLGTDLVKDPVRLVAAYDDAAGVTAAFDLNMMHVLNRELGADFTVGSFEHVARWDAEHEWVEMSLRSTVRQVVSVAALDLQVRFETGERMRTEVSSKFRPDRVRAELAEAGLRLEQWWQGDDADFALSLSVPEQPQGPLARRTA